MRMRLGALAILIVGGCSSPPLPLAVAGADQMVTVGDLVKLDGSGSIDPEMKPLSYQWEFVALPAGSHAALTAELAYGSTAVNPSFVADVGGDYVVRLVVRAEERVSLPSEVKISAGAAACGHNRPVAQMGVLSPVAIPAPVAAPPDVAAQLLVGQEVQLDGSASTSMDLMPPCSLMKSLLFRWRFVSLPLGSSARFNDDQVLNPSFRLDELGEYLVELVVTDSTGLASVEARAKFIAFDPRVTVPGGAGPYNSLVLDPSTMSSPKIAFYNANQKRAAIAVCTGNCDTAPVWATHVIDTGANLTPASNDVGAFMSLGVSAAGTLFAGYYDAQNCRSVMAFSADHGVTWKSYPVDPNTACLATGRNGQWLSLAVSPLNGNPSIAYQYNNNGTRTLKYAVCTANCASASMAPTWVFSTVDAVTAETGYYTSLAFDPTGTAENRPAIAYRVNGATAPVMYASCTGTCDTAGATWVLATADTNLDSIQTGGQNGTGVSLAFASTGAPSIAYRDEGKKSLKYTQCAAGGCTASVGWSASTVDGMNDAGEYPSLALSPATATLNRPRITYRDANAGSLKLASYNGSNWQTVTLDDTGDPRMSSLKLTAKDGVRASYDRNNIGLRYIFFGP